MTRVAIVTDSASDLPSGLAADAGITVVPLLVRFGEREYRTGVDISNEEFYGQLRAPDAPFPTTAAASPGSFRAAFEGLLRDGASAVVCVTVGGKLSGTVNSARIARDAIGGGLVHVVDSGTASMAQGMLVQLAAEMACHGSEPRTIVAELERRLRDVRVYVALETLEYLRRGGRISGAQAAIGTLLSVKPIITIEGGAVEAAERVRTRARARNRLIELLTAQPLERIAVVHTMSEDIEEFADRLAAAAGVARASIPIHLIGPSVAPHVGPGAYGGVVLRRAA